MQLPREINLKFACSYSDSKVRLRVMLFHSVGGSYPRGTFFCDDGFFHADEELVFSTVRCEGWRSIDEDVPFSEFAWASPAQVRLLGALLFCQTFDGSWIGLYPAIGPQLVLDVEDLDTTDPRVVSAIKERLLRALRAPVGLPVTPYLPKVLDEREPYGFVGEDVAMERLAISYTKIDPSNFVLMRGIQALVKSDMLGRHREFGEESLIAMFIALDASFCLVQRELRMEGLANPSAHDAAQWLHRKLYAPFGHQPPSDLDKYFEEFYESRISTFHPGSRFGDFPFSPAIWDDAIYLRSQLRQVFSVLVHGSHFEDFDLAVAEYLAERAAAERGASD